MRRGSLMAVLILATAGAALAQEYVEYKSQQDRFAVTFPTQPTITEGAFKSQFGSNAANTHVRIGFWQQSL
jgi:hypothetical protein